MLNAGLVNFIKWKIGDFLVALNNLFLLRKEGKILEKVIYFFFFEMYAFSRFFSDKDLYECFFL